MNRVKPGNCETDEQLMEKETKAQAPALQMKGKFVLVKINHNDLNLFGVGINWWSKCSSFARFFFAIFSIKIYWVNSYYHIEKEIRENVKNKV